MVINFLTNTFGSYKRQDISVQSWMYIKDLFKDAQDVQVNWYDLQFRSQEQTFKSPYPGLQTVFCLSDSKDVVPGASKNLPFLNEIFEYGLSLDGDYFVIHNSDIMIMPYLMGHIVENRPLSWSSSRVNVNSVDKFLPDLRQYSLKSYSIGHDLFVFDRKWALTHQSFFTTPYLMGSPVFDMVWAGLIKTMGDNKPMGNSFPPFLLHIDHPETWKGVDTVETHWNADQTKKNPLNMMMLNIMNYHTRINIFKKRKENLLSITEEEKSWEIDFFNQMSYNRPIF